MGILARIFGMESSQQERSNDKKPQSGDFQIVCDYSDLVKYNPPAPEMIYDEKSLPHPKETIKQALFNEIKLEKRKEVKEALKVIYTELAHFQQGIGSEPQGVDVSKLDFDENNLEKTLQQFKDQMEGSKNWRSVVSNEREKLYQEVNNL